MKDRTTIPYTPQQNSVAKRVNRTLLNMVRSMMFFKNVELMFWGEAMLCAEYIRNRCPSPVINNRTPYEMWYSRLPVIKNYRTFGSQCYALIPKHQRNKLSEQSRKYIYFRVFHVF